VSLDFAVRLELYEPRHNAFVNCDQRCGARSSQSAIRPLGIGGVGLPPFGSKQHQGTLQPAELDAVIAEACRPWQHQIELLQTIPGVGETVAQVLVAETGADMSRFPTPAHLAAWAGLAPAMHESAGRQTRPGSGTATNG